MIQERYVAHGVVHSNWGLSTHKCDINLSIYRLVVVLNINLHLSHTRCHIVFGNGRLAGPHRGGRGGVGGVGWVTVGTDLSCGPVSSAQQERIWRGHSRHNTKVSLDSTFTINSMNEKVPHMAGEEALLENFLLNRTSALYANDMQEPVSTSQPPTHSAFMPIQQYIC